MILLIDAGNTRIKWGAWSGAEWHAQGALPVADAAALGPLLAGLGPIWIGISCVAGESVRGELTRLCEAAGVMPFWLASDDARFGVTNRYTQPGTLGTDRYAMLIAAHHAGLAPCVVVGAGTAVTVDALTGEGEFPGGMILPGAGLMRLSLAGGTAALKMAEGEWASFPTGTAGAVATGIWTAIVSAVAAMRERLQRRLGREAGVVLAGGDAAALLEFWNAEQPDDRVRVVENLVLEGLLWVARDLDVPGA